MNPEITRVIALVRFFVRTKPKNASCIGNTARLFGAGNGGKELERMPDIVRIFLNSSVA